MTELKRIREAQGLSQSELALYAHIPLRTLQSLDQGVRDIRKASAEMVLDLALILGVSPFELLYGKLWYKASQDRRRELLRTCADDYVEP